MAADFPFLDEGEVESPEICILNDIDNQTDEEGTNTTGLLIKCSMPDCDKLSIKKCSICDTHICSQHVRAYETEEVCLYLYE